METRSATWHGSEQGSVTLDHSPRMRATDGTVDAAMSKLLAGISTEAAAVQVGAGRRTGRTGRGRHV